MKNSKKENVNEKIEKLRPDYNKIIPDDIKHVEYRHKDIAPINRRFCIYHPVTTAYDCLKCQEPCSILGNLMPPEIEKLIEKPMRDKIMEYFWGGDSPLVELAEKTGITLTVELIRTEPMWAPQNISYLKEKDIDKKTGKRIGEPRPMNFDEFYNHLRLFYQGRLAWQALGTIVQAGLAIMTLPQELRNLVAYYEFHRDAMTGKIDPEKKMLIDEIKDSLPDTLKEKEMDFSDVDSAVKYFLSMAIDILKKEKGQKEDEIVSEINSFVRTEIDKN